MMFKERELRVIRLRLNLNREKISKVASIIMSLWMNLRPSLDTQRRVELVDVILRKLVSSVGVTIVVKM